MMIVVLMMMEIFGKDLCISCKLDDGRDQWWDLLLLLECDEDSNDEGENRDECEVSTSSPLENNDSDLGDRNER